MKKTIAILLLTLLTLACEDTEYSPIPDVDILLPVYLSDNKYIMLDAGTSDSIVDEGYAGIIIYCVIRDEQYHAYDLCCPIHYEEKEHLTLDGAVAMCPTDSALFPLHEGEPAIEMNNSTNPSILKSYSSTISNGVLIIQN